LQKICVGIIIEVNNLLEVIFGFIYKDLKKTLHNLCFTATSLTAEHWTMIYLNELFN
jgi:hypothetical protein